MNAPAESPRVVVTYGDLAQHRVEFRLAADGATIEGRYLIGADGIGRCGPWEPRRPDSSSDEAHIAILAALREVLTQYAACGPEEVTATA